MPARLPCLGLWAVAFEWRKNQDGNGGANGNLTIVQRLPTEADRQLSGNRIKLLNDPCQPLGAHRVPPLNVGSWQMVTFADSNPKTGIAALEPLISTT